MKRIIALVIIAILIAAWTQALRQATVDLAPSTAEIVSNEATKSNLRMAGAMPAGVPTVEYLGQGGTYTVAPGLNFIVKRLNPFRFDYESGPIYTAAPDERVWTTNNDVPPAEYHSWLDFGAVFDGCKIEYLAIDDDIDDRINHFYLDDTPIYEMPQGMVTSGEFVITGDGNLRLYAADSIGMWIAVCETIIEPTPQPTATSTATIPPTATASPTATQTASPTPTGTLPPTATATATAVATNTPFPPSATVLPPKLTATPSVTATNEPRENTCLRINFDIGGDVAKRGLYVVQEVGGHVLYSWFAEDGWQDSGWVQDIDITYPSVYVQVLYYSGPGAEPVEMEIVNPAPDSTYGWLSRGMCHALEVKWPDE